MVGYFAVIVTCRSSINSTALTAAVLYQYGTGPVKGFAVTLIAGIAASMISSIFVVKTFFLIWLNRNKTAETLSI